MNLNAIADPKQHEFRQIVFAIEKSAGMSIAASNLNRIIYSVTKRIKQGSSERQFSLILFDDIDINFVTSTYDPDIFVNQFSEAMLQVINSPRAIDSSRSVEVIFKVPQITILSPTILYLFTSTAAMPFDRYTRSLPRDLQVNLFTVSSSGDFPVAGDLIYHQRASGGRNLPVTPDRVLQVRRAAF
ncbi:unnamed protein product [Strongylus vulgaris]|uniref:VWFA domain-containing protein n=1 Tax=Strongylus vulgaris TaxID=40348 RepID=A0A3P7KS58_STRVU|nr:unnamed protein product [Strongylus vulgaris]